VAPNHSSSADQVSPAHGWLKFGRATGCVAGKVQPPQPPRCVQQPAGEKIAMARIVILARIGVWPAVLGIIVLSVLPGNMRPDVLGNKAVEHFIAYFIANSLFAIRYLRPWQWLSSGVLLVLCAGGLEFIQHSTMDPRPECERERFCRERAWCVDRSSSHSRRQRCA
jgi:hypothetical protein